jgi:hypothetical protein
MRWLLTLLGVLLLVWLASGDARAAPPPYASPTPPTPHIRGVAFGSPAPGIVGALVTLAPDACSEGRVLQARFTYLGDVYVVEAPLPPCPSPPLFLGRALEAPPAGESAVVSHAYVVERYAGPEGVFTQRYPGGGQFLPAQPLTLPAGPLPAIALSAADVGAVGGLWVLAWWRDPSRAVRASSSPQSPGR